MFRSELYFHGAGDQFYSLLQCSDYFRDGDPARQVGISEMLQGLSQIGIAAAQAAVAATDENRLPPVRY